ncbi:AbfB domain-containing protein [Streptomyces sp. NBC_01190]|uniref:AbfB domain-containing protein n=1 Tax=Streptomyces sp. NBC_01190 TaxID=2903767 RepID=UPI0038676293
MGSASHTHRGRHRCPHPQRLRRDDSDSNVVISPMSAASSAMDKGDATWIVRAGLADSSCVSFRIASNGGSNAWDSATSWPDDTSWNAAGPWS